MQIEHNKPSPHMQASAYIWPFLLLKLCTRPGLPDYAKTDIHLLLLHFKIIEYYKTANSDAFILAMGQFQLASHPIYG